MCVLRIMYKTRNTGTGNGMRGTRGMGGMLYSGECRQTFWEMLQNIPENVAKMSSNIPGNVAKHSGVCHKTFRGMSPNIPGNVTKYSGKCRQTFRGTSPNIPANVANFWCKEHGCIQNPIEHPRWSSSAKIANDLNTLTISAIKLHGRCSTGFHMRL